MAIEVKVPALPESVSDATIADWHKKVGDKVSRDENLVDLETDKVVLEVPCPTDGVLKEIKAEGGDTVSADDVIAVIEEGASGGNDSADDKGDAKDAKTEDSASKSDAKSEDSVSSAASDDEDLSPAVRRLVNENDLDPDKIKGTGRNGRLTKEDVMKYLEGGGKASGRDDNAQTGTSGARDEKRVPMSRLRKRVAERMMEAQENAAMLTSFNEVNLARVMGIRKQYKEAFEAKHGIKLGFMSFFVKAAAEALKKHPVVNAAVDGDDIIYHGYADIGIAVATDRGLMVPVLRNAENMTLAEIEQNIAGYAKKARAGTIGMDDLKGGTFTITNGGVFGSLISTPMLNPPQSAILGMHTIKERPIVENGEIKAAPMMYIALTYDHRIVDGKDAVQFLVAIKDALEDPHRLLLDL
jgi:2-oxoglutarate dehydrogenase E2 component (dihydrolipoamide succinyltransferase)